MGFQPQVKEPESVPWFRDAREEDGWRGHTTSKSLQKLQAEVTTAIGRLGCLVLGFQRGTHTIHGQQREGFRILYIVKTVGGQIPGQLDIAALPVENLPRLKRTYVKRQSQSLKMALFMLRDTLAGQWFLQKLAPGYVAMIPWMLDRKTSKTVTQLCYESITEGNLLVSGEVFEGVFTEE